MYKFVNLYYVDATTGEILRSLEELDTRAERALVRVLSAALVLEESPAKSQRQEHTFYFREVFQKNNNLVARARLLVNPDVYEKLLCTNGKHWSVMPSLVEASVRALSNLRLRATGTDPNLEFEKISGCAKFDLSLNLEFEKISGCAKFDLSLKLRELLKSCFKLIIDKMFSTTDLIFDVSDAVNFPAGANYCRIARN